MRKLKSYDSLEEFLASKWVRPTFESITEDLRLKKITQSEYNDLDRYYCLSPEIQAIVAKENLSEAY